MTGFFQEMQKCAMPGQQLLLCAKGTLRISILAVLQLLLQSCFAHQTITWSVPRKIRHKKSFFFNKLYNEVREFSSI